MFPEISYRVRSFMAFKANELAHDLNHGIVCDNAPILCTCVYLGMARNVSKGSFVFLAQKINFPFSKCRKRVICEAGTYNVLPKWGTPFLINSRPHFMGISPIGCISKLSIHFSTKWQVSADLVESGWNLN